MKIWKYTALPVIAVLLVGCAQSKKTVTSIKAPLIVADATPVLSASKRSVGVRVNFENIADSDYNYARFKLTAYNNEGQNIRPKKGKRESAYVRLAGPIAPGQTKSTIWTNTWNSRNFDCISLDEVEIIFMDGSIETANGSRLLSKVKGNTCI